MNAKFWIVCKACKAEFKDIKIAKRCRNCNASDSLEERFEPELLERFAKLYHQNKQFWNQELLHRLNEHALAHKTLDEFALFLGTRLKDNWKEYETLSEESKEINREQAKKAMKLIDVDKSPKFEGT